LQVALVVLPVLAELLVIRVMRGVQVTPETTVQEATEVLVVLRATPVMRATQVFLAIREITAMVELRVVQAMARPVVVVQAKETLT
jgi:hypothetical protein